ncbi:MAG: outer membrane beta-barrel protein [bacterium]
MKKGFLIVLSVLMLASFASANRTRIATMGWNDVLLWDEENIFWCPALAAGYPNEIIGELGTYPPATMHSDAVLGAFLTNDEMASMGVFGVVVNRQTAAVPYTVFLDPIPSFDLIYAKSLGGFGFGGMLTFARNSWSNEPADTTSIDQSTMVVGFTPGLTFAIGEKGSMDLGFGFQMTSFSNDDKQSGAKYESDGAMSFGMELRAMLPMGQYVFLIPYFGFDMGNLNWKYTSSAPAPDTTWSVTEDKQTSFGGGIGLNIMPFEETTVLAGFGFGLTSEENTDQTIWIEDSLNKTSDMVPGFVFAAESRFNSWMTGRIGAWKTFFASHTDENYHGDKASNATDSFQMAIGIGMNFGDFTLDAMLHDNFLFDGPNFIGGAVQPPNWMLSAEYNFSGM